MDPQNARAAAPSSVGFVEIYSFSGSLAVADVMAKAGAVHIAGIEVNGAGGMGIKITGPAGDVRASVQAGVDLGRKMNVLQGFSEWPRYAPQADRVIHSRQQFNRIMSSYDHLLPDGTGIQPARHLKGPVVIMAGQDAIGLIETQGLVGLLEATDAMLKAAAVELIGTEKIGAAYITVMVKGDVAAVKAAVEAGTAAVERVGGKLILSHVIARPHNDLLSLLPKQ